MDDIALLADLKEKKCRKAFEALFRKYYKTLSLYSFYIVKNEMDAEDVVQNLFAEFWEKELYCQVHTSIKGYLQTAVYNRSLNLLTKEKTFRKNLDKYTYLFKDDADEPIIDNKNDILLSDMLGSMPERQFEAMKLVYLQDKKYSEAADEMGITLNSVKTHLKLAVKLLRKQVGINLLKG